MRALVFFFVVLVAASAWAHKRDLSYVDVREQGATLVLTVDIDPHDTPLVERIDRDGDGVMTVAEIDAQRPALEAFVLGRVALKKVGAACVARRLPTIAFYPDVQMWHAEATFDCPAAAASFTLYLGYIDALPRSHRAMLKVVSDGRVRVQTVIEPRQAIIEPRDGSWLATGARFVQLGVHHIFDGLDHLAFVLALIVAAGSLRRALLLLSAFTVAHSLSLVLSALAIVRLPEKPVEVTIALSIAVVAIEAMRDRSSLRLRVALAFGFGLVHGLGFAAVLADALFSSSAFIWSLAAFNAGIELGQAWLVVCVLPGLLAVQAGRARVWHFAIAGAGPWVILFFAHATNAVLVFAFVLVLFGLARAPRTAKVATRAASVVLALAGFGWAVERVLAGA
ncbi:MAG: HupE/UreJ family protein [Deltaproteobacteria bacterium]|nr:HupE/UreJ family protein [Deltaproteobacteria bacterium]